MKRLLTIILAGFLAIPLWGPAAASSSSRRATQSYSRSNGFVIAGVVYASYDLATPVPNFSARRGETKVSFRIEDDFGAPVRGHIHIDRDGDGDVDGARDFCGSTTKPLPITFRSEIDVWLYSGTCPDSTPAFATSGKVTATFSK
ncbi:MAG: hypothetical protein ACRDK3_08345 [Actinomycetota bacterium]